VAGIRLSTRHLIVLGACAPVAFFGYPGKPSALSPPGCNIQTLAAPHEDLTGALGALAEAIGAPSATMRLADGSRWQRYVHHPILVDPGARGS
jgi:hypothetical protein